MSNKCAERLPTMRLVRLIHVYRLLYEYDICAVTGTGTDQRPIGYRSDSKFTVVIRP